MKKFSWIAIFILSIATHCAYSSNGDEEVAFRNGFYTAFSLGINWANADWSGQSSIALVDDINDTNAFFLSWTPHGKGNHAKITGNVALGYQLVDNRLFLGSQISYTGRDQHDFFLDEARTYQQVAPGGAPPLSTVSGSSFLKSKVSLACNEFDIDLKPGVLISKNFVLYGRLGVAFTRLNIRCSGVWTEGGSENSVNLQGTSSHSNPNSGTPFVLGTTDSSHHSQSTVGFRVGVGAEYLISQQWGISIDYIFTSYGKIKTRIENQTSGFFDFNQVYGVYSPEVKITTQTLMVGIVFHF